MTYPANDNLPPGCTDADIDHAAPKHCDECERLGNEVDDLTTDAAETRAAFVESLHGIQLELRRIYRRLDSIRETRDIITPRSFLAQIADQNDALDRLAQRVDDIADALGGAQ